MARPVKTIVLLVVCKALDKVLVNGGRLCGLPATLGLGLGLLLLERGLLARFLQFRLDVRELGNLVG
jgi:hypothetical protein